MKLVSFTVENFRCYQLPFRIKVDSFTAIVGRNDIGKSALLEALAIFFEQSKLDQHDASIEGDRSNVRITCEFSDLPSQLILDTDNPTTLEREFLLNTNGNLEITKTYNATLATPKTSKITANAEHPTSKDYSDLLTLKQSDLIRRAEALGVDLGSVNNSKNAEIRAAIWSFSQDLKLAPSQVDLQKEAGKKAWGALNKYLPTYWLFKSDRASTDQDSEAQDPLNAAIAEALKLVETDLEAITEKVRAEVDKVAKLTLEKLAELDPNLSESLDPIVKTKKWAALFQTSVTGDNGIPLNKRGSGVRRLILLSFFRAQAEAHAAETNSPSVIYAIEEPETSQHPRNQRLLLSTLQRLTTDPSRQVMMTTHTPMLARAVPEKQLRFIHDAGTHRVLANGGEELNQEISKSLGVLADHSVKAFICVEGPNDITFLMELSKVMIEAGEDIPDLAELQANGEIIFVPLGGSCLALWMDRLQALNRPEIHICDRDNPLNKTAKYAVHVDAVNARDGCIAFNTNKREMENYIHPKAIIEAYRVGGLEISLPEVFQDFEDVPETVAQAIHTIQSDVPWSDVSDDKKKQKSSRAKKVINGEAASRMTLERLGETGGYAEITSWLQAVHALTKEAN